ncbi:MAG: ankyrin repeat domain-containing protein [Schlesneria sp.]
MNLDNNAINLRTMDVYGRYGLICRFDANAPGLDQAIRRIVFELGAEENPRPDFEHETVFVMDADGWSVAARVSGLVSFVNVNSPSDIVYLRDLPRDELASLFFALAAGDLAHIRRQKWKRRSELAPFTKNFYLYANHPLKTDLMKAAHLGQISWAEQLINQGADINAQDEQGATALHIAALCEDVPMCELLLRNGADPEIRDSGHATCDDYALNNVDICNLIQEFRQS